MTDTFDTTPLPKLALTRTPATLRTRVDTLNITDAHDLTEFNKMTTTDQPTDQQSPTLAPTRTSAILRTRVDSLALGKDS